VWHSGRRRLERELRETGEPRLRQGGQGPSRKSRPVVAFSFDCHASSEKLLVDGGVRAAA
jgi:hypothetical protein